MLRPIVFAACIAITAAPAAADPLGNWVIRREKSQMTDQPTFIASIDSDAPINCGWNNGDKIRLVVRCSEGALAFFFVTGCHMTSSLPQYENIEIRLDNDQATSFKASTSTNNKAIGFWDDNNVYKIMTSIKGKNRLLARMTPYNNNSFIASFAINSPSSIIDEATATCNIK